MANIDLKKGIITLLLALICSNLFSTKLFYLSTERTFSVDEDKKVKVESGRLNEVKIRVYKIEDPHSYFLTQEDFHRPKVKGRKFRYVSPDVIKGFRGYLKDELRSWGRSRIPTQERSDIISRYSDLSIVNDNRYYKPSKQVDVIKDDNFTLVKEKKYIFEKRRNNWNTNYVYFNNLPVGTYLIEGIAGDKLAYTVLNVSDFSFITKKSGQSLLVYAVDSETGEPVKSIEVNLYNKFNKKLDSKRTNKSGLANFRTQDDNLFIFASNGNGSYSFYDPKYYPATSTGERFYIYTDRPVYKGGDSVNIKGIIREKNGDDFIVPDPHNLEIKIINPQGTVVERTKTESNTEGSFSSTITLPENSKSGLYKVVSTSKGKSYESEFKVEYYVKPDFRLIVSPGNSTYLPEEEIVFKVKGEYYHGDPVRNLSVKYTISRSRFDFKDVSRDDLDSFLSVGEWQYSGIERLSNGEIWLDNNGEGEIRFTVNKKDINKPSYNYIVSCIGNNPSGTDVTGAGRVKVVSSNINYSVKTHKFVYEPGEDITYTIDVTDYDSNPVVADLKASLFSGKELIDTIDLTSDKNGYIEFTTVPEKSGVFKIVLSGKDRSGNRRSVEKQVWVGESGASYTVAGGFVKLVLDKSYYNSSESAKLLVISPIEDISLLLTVEGNDIYKKDVIKLDGNSSVIEIPIKKKYLPNAFVNVDFIFENRHYNNSIKIDIPPVDNFLNIEVEPEKEFFTPNTTGKIKIKVTDNSGKPVPNSEVSVAIIDEAIYSIQEDLTIDIRKFFYPFRRNNVTTWTSTAFRFYGYAYNVRRELALKHYKNATGIAAFKGGDDEEARDDFKDAIFWEPSIRTNSRGEAVIRVNFPGNITSWRLTSIAIDKDTRVGISRDNIITKKEVITHISSPVVVSDKDNFDIFYSINNSSSVKKELGYRVEFNNLESSTIEKSIELEAGEVYRGSLRASSIENGEAKVMITVYEDGNIADKVVKKINVDNLGFDKNFTKSSKLVGGSKTIGLNKPEDMDREPESFTVTLLDSYSGHINDSLEYLIQYPYGCVEQTTNKFLPNLAVLESYKNLGVIYPKRVELDKNVKAGIASLSSYQNSNGSWGWWDGSSSNSYMSAYVLQGLLRARNQGYYVSDDVIDSGLDFLRNNIGSGKAKLFSLYALSLGKIRVNSVFDSIDYKELSDYELSLFIRTQKNYRVSTSSSVDELISRMKKSGKFIYWSGGRGYRWDTDDIETTAHVLVTLEDNLEDGQYNKGIDYLISKKVGKRWKSTRDTGAAVIAISKEINRNDIDESKIKVSFNNKSIDPVITKLDSYRLLIDLDDYTILNRNSIKISSPYKNLTANISIKYKTTSDKILEANNGVSIKRSYYTLNDDLSIGARESNFNKGDNILVKLEIKPDVSGGYIMVNDNIPGGTTFNRDINLSDLEVKNTIPDFIDPRYGVVNFFYEDGGSKTLYYVIVAQYPGRFSVNPVYSEFMYYPEVNGNSSSDIITIGER